MLQPYCILLVLFESSFLSKSMKCCQCFGQTAVWTDQRLIKPQHSCCASPGSTLTAQHKELFEQELKWILIPCNMGNKHLLHKRFGYSLNDARLIPLNVWWQHLQHLDTICQPAAVLRPRRRIRLRGETYLKFNFWNISTGLKWLNDIFFQRHWKPFRKLYSRLYNSNRQSHK